MTTTMDTSATNKAQTSPKAIMSIDEGSSHKDQHSYQMVGEISEGR